MIQLVIEDHLQYAMSPHRDTTRDNMNAFPGEVSKALKFPYSRFSAFTPYKLMDSRFSLTMYIPAHSTLVSSRLPKILSGILLVRKLHNGTAFVYHFVHAFALRVSRLEQTVLLSRWNGRECQWKNMPAKFRRQLLLCNYRFLSYKRTLFVAQRFDISIRLHRSRREIMSSCLPYS